MNVNNDHFAAEKLNTGLCQRAEFALIRSISSTSRDPSLPIPRQTDDYSASRSRDFEKLHDPRTQYDWLVLKDHSFCNIHPQGRITI